jgi:hypothetical protein
MAAKPKSSREVEALVRALLREPLEDKVLRERLETLAREPAFQGLTWLWGPVLYQRNRVLFRPFILSHFSVWSWEPWGMVPWKGDTGRKLDDWISEADRLDDIELFRRLYSWKHPSFSGLDTAVWTQDLVIRFRVARTPAARAAVLRKLDVWSALDEETALELYRLDPRAAAPFVLRHLPRERHRWPRLEALAQDRGDTGFAGAIYRNLVSGKEWLADIRRLCAEVSDPAAFCEELRRHHPRAHSWQVNLSVGFLEIVQQRGRDGLPYVLQNARDASRTFHIRGDAFRSLLELARKRQWIDLWAALVRAGANAKEFNAEVRRLADDVAALPPAETVRRLLALAGVGREWSFRGLGLSVVQQLDDSTAVALYRSHPEILRGPYKIHLQSASWRSAPHYPKLTEAAIAAEDEELVDFLASRMLTRTAWALSARGARPIQEAERLADFYAGLKTADPAAFSQRAVAVLAQVPAYAIWRYKVLVAGNRLARLLFERSAESFLALPDLLDDLLEAQEIHVQALAYRIAGTDDPRAREVAARRLDLLLATLLRPLHRTTRLLAFEALANAARFSPEAAARVLARAREALDLPDRDYPKEALVGLIGRALHAWPELRGPRERPVVWGSRGSAA